MTRQTLTTLVAALLTGLVGSITPAHAQELTVGYHVDRVEQRRNHMDAMPGFHLEAGRTRGPATLVVLFERTTYDDSHTTLGLTMRESGTFSTLGFGARWGGAARTAPVKPFVEGVFGTMMHSSTMEFIGAGYHDAYDNGTSSLLMAQASAGLLVRVSSKVDLSARGDYRLGFDVFGSGHLVGATAGLRYRFK